MRFVLGMLAFLLLVGWGSWELIEWGMERDAQRAERYCAVLGAASVEYVGDGHYLCLSADGRVLGRS